jgi:hypothetical protein
MAMLNNQMVLMEVQWTIIEVLMDLMAVNHTSTIHIWYFINRGFSSIIFYIDIQWCIYLSDVWGQTWMDDETKTRCTHMQTIDGDNDNMSGQIIVTSLWPRCDLTGIMVSKGKHLHCGP